MLFIIDIIVNHPTMEGENMTDGTLQKMITIVRDENDGNY